MIRQIALFALAGATLSACTSVERLRPDVEARTLPSRLDEIAYINVLREAFIPETKSTVDCYRGDNTYFRGPLSQGYREHTPEQEGLSSRTTPATSGIAATNDCVTYATNSLNIRRYLEAGFGLSDIYCQRFFIVANQASLKRRFARNAMANLDTLIGSVLALATAGETTLGIVNAGFGAIDSSFQGVDDAFLVAPDLENVRALVHASQDAYRSETFANIPQSYPSARSVIERYAGICSYTGMRRLVNVSISDQANQLQAQTDARRPGTRAPAVQQGQNGGQQAPAQTEQAGRLPASTPPPPTPRN